MSFKEILFGDHYKELGRRRVFSRKKYFYEFLVLIFLISSSIYSYAGEEVKEEENMEAKILCKLRAYDSDLYSIIEEVLKTKNIKLICPKPTLGA